jgi:cytochrome P450
VTDRPPRAPGAQPVAGHTLSFLRAPLASLRRWGQQESSVVRVRVAGRTVCLATTPAAAKQVLVTDSDDYQKATIVRERLGTLQGNSLVLLEGEEWRDRREMLQSGFTPSAVTAMAGVTTGDAREMVSDWPVGAPVEVVEEARNLVLGILAETLFGLDLRGEETPIHEAATDILARMDMRSVSTYLPEWVPTPTNRRFRAAVATLHEELDTQLADSADGGDSLLGVMRRAGLPAETIRDELIALLFAGYDSTATALTCALGLLGNYPDVQSRLRTELEAALGDNRPTPSALSALPVLDAVVDETLRLYPPQYALFREPTSPVRLQGYEIDTGTIVVVSPWVLHRNPALWDDPAAFRPTRWLDESTPRSEFAYIPYGAGKRHCLGRRLANQILRLTVATVCQKRQLQAQQPVDVSAGPTLAVEEPLELRTFRDTSG